MNRTLLHAQEPSPVATLASAPDRAALPDRMRAIRRTDAGARLVVLPLPALEYDDDVLLRVRLAGICRTDLYVLDGRYGPAATEVTGHEFVAEVVRAGPAVREFAPGDRVTATPLVAEDEILGVQRPGAFAEYLVLPRSCLFAVPSGLDDRLAAYSEPAAAALAVEAAGLTRADRVLLAGEGRIAELTERALARLRPRRLLRCSFAELARGAVAPGSFDCAVETGARDDELALLVEALRPGGRLVLKSRPAEPVRFDLRRAVEKDLTLRCVRYGSFARAIDALATGALRVDDLLGPVFALDDFAAAFAAARASEARKIFIRTAAD